MAKMHLDRLRRKHGFIGKKYQDLMKRILANNTEAVSRATARISNENYSKSLKRIRKKEQRFILPDISEALPKRSVFVLKDAERGERLTDTLRSELDKQLRGVLTDLKQRKQPVFITRRGVKAGRISPVAISEFEKRIRTTFTNYTKKDKRYGIPANIHTIAVTEVRSTVNEIKEQYNQRLLKKNPDKLRMFKKWIHNPTLSAEPRPHHMQMNGRMIKGTVPFSVRRKIKKKGRWVQVGWTKMMRPHDPTAPPDQVINCNCDVDYFMRTVA